MSGQYFYAEGNWTTPRTFPTTNPDGIWLEPGYYWLVVRMPSSMGWVCNTLAGPFDAQRPMGIINMMNWPPKWYKMRRTALMSFDGCFVPTPPPDVAPITNNVTVDFNDQEPTVAVSAPIVPPGNNDRPAGTTSLVSSLSGVAVGSSNSTALTSTSCPHLRLPHGGVAHQQLPLSCKTTRFQS